MRYSEETKQKARALYAQGLSLCEVGRRLGVGHKTVCFWVNPEAAELNRERSRRWQQENPELNRERSRRWYQENPEHKRESGRRWQQENPEKARERKAFRRAAKRQATPPWLTPEHRRQMRALHDKAKDLEKRTGIPHHVDHIIPLRAKFDVAGEQIACGLHVPWNLRVIPGPDNCSKNCKLPGPKDWTAPTPGGIMKESQTKP